MPSFKHLLVGVLPCIIAAGQEMPEIVYETNAAANSGRDATGLWYRGASVLQGLKLITSDDHFYKYGNPLLTVGMESHPSFGWGRGGGTVQSDTTGNLTLLYSPLATGDIVKDLPVPAQPRCVFHMDVVKVHQMTDTKHNPGSLGSYDRHYIAVNLTGAGLENGISDEEATRLMSQLVGPGDGGWWRRPHDGFPKCKNSVDKVNDEKSVYFDEFFGQWIVLQNVYTANMHTIQCYIRKTLFAMAKDEKFGGCRIDRVPDGW